MSRTSLVKLQSIAFSYTALTLLFLASGCTFNHDWKQATRQSSPAAGLEGPWEGSWKSDVDGHSGRLRSLIRKKTDALYEARFHANYRKILTFNYTVLLTTERTHGAFQFHGAANLGWYAGGVYKYEGHADATNFFSTYSSKYDRGTFELRRPAVADH